MLRNQKIQQDVEGAMKTVIIVVLAFAMVACDKRDQYQLTTSDLGRVYRLNKSTGEISLIEGYTVTRLQEPRTE